MTVATPDLPDRGTQNGTDYTSTIDAAVKVLSEIGFQFAVHEQTTPNMTVRVEAGIIRSGTTLTQKAAQNTGTITKPTTNPRYDVVVIHRTTGVASVITGTEAASPALPTVSRDYIPKAWISLTTSTTTITNDVITAIPPSFVDLLEGLYISQFLRNDIDQTFAGQSLHMTHDIASLSFDDAAPDGLGIKRMECNNGAGNWNREAGVYGGVSALYAADNMGAVREIISMESTDGSWKMQTAVDGGASGQGTAISWANSLELTTTGLTTTNWFSCASLRIGGTQVISSGRAITATSGTVNGSNIMNTGDVQTFTAQKNFSNGTITSSAGSATWNCQTKQSSAIALTENTTLGASNMVNYGTYVLRVTNGASWTLGFSSAFKWANGVAPSAPTSGKVLTISCASDGTYLICSYGAEAA